MVISDEINVMICINDAAKHMILTMSSLTEDDKLAELVNLLNPGGFSHHTVMLCSQTLFRSTEHYFKFPHSQRQNYQMCIKWWTRHLKYFHLGVNIIELQRAVTIIYDTVKHVGISLRLTFGLKVLIISLCTSFQTMFPVIPIK